MWAPEGRQLETDALGDISPVEVLFEFEEPLTFVSKDPDGQSLLVHCLSTEGGVSRYLVAVADDRIVNELKQGQLDLLSGLRQPRCWIVDLAGEWKVVGLWLVPFEKIPKDVLPLPGTMVTPDLDPIFKLRLIGPGVGPGNTSAADIRMAAQAAETGLRGLARLAFDEKKKAGAVPRTLRDFSDLPYQFTRAASFEIAFGRPRGRLVAIDDEVFAEMGRLLDLGLHSIRDNGGETTDIEDLNSDQALQLLEAIKALTPPTRGDVEKVEVGGGLVEEIRASKVLTRDDRTTTIRRIKAARKFPRKEEPFRITGVIEEADQGVSTFTLRQLDPASLSRMDGLAEINFRFEDHLYDTVMDAFNSLERMTVVGERVDSAYQALDVQLAATVEETESEHEIPGSE